MKRSTILSRAVLASQKSGGRGSSVAALSSVLQQQNNVKNTNQASLGVASTTRRFIHSSDDSSSSANPPDDSLLFSEEGSFKMDDLWENPAEEGEEGSSADATNADATSDQYNSYEIVPEHEDLSEMEKLKNYRLLNIYEDELPEDLITSPLPEKQKELDLLVDIVRMEAEKEHSDLFEFLQSNSDFSPFEELISLRMQIQEQYNLKNFREEQARLKEQRKLALAREEARAAKAPPQEKPPAKAKKPNSKRVKRVILENQLRRRKALELEQEQREWYEKHLKDYRDKYISLHNEEIPKERRLAILKGLKEKYGEELRTPFEIFIDRYYGKPPRFDEPSEDIIPRSFPTGSVAKLAYKEAILKWRNLSLAGRLQNAMRKRYFKMIGAKYPGPNLLDRQQVEKPLRIYLKALKNKQKAEKTRLKTKKAETKQKITIPGLNLPVATKDSASQVLLKNFFKRENLGPVSFFLAMVEKYDPQMEQLQTQLDEQRAAAVQIRSQYNLFISSMEEMDKDDVTELHVRFSHSLNPELEQADGTPSTFSTKKALQNAFNRAHESLMQQYNQISDRVQDTIEQLILKVRVRQVANYYGIVLPLVVDVKPISVEEKRAAALQKSQEVDSADLGSVYTTGGHLVSYIDETGRKVMFEVPKSDLVKTFRQRPNRAPRIEDRSGWKGKDYGLEVVKDREAIRIREHFKYERKTQGRNFPFDLGPRVMDEWKVYERHLKSKVNKIEDPNFADSLVFRKAALMNSTVDMTLNHAIQLCEDVWRKRYVPSEKGDKFTKVLACLADYWKELSSRDPEKERQLKHDQSRARFRQYMYRQLLKQYVKEVLQQGKESIETNTPAARDALRMTKVLDNLAAQLNAVGANPDEIRAYVSQASYQHTEPSWFGRQLATLREMMDNLDEIIELQVNFSDATVIDGAEQIADQLALVEQHIANTSTLMYLSGARISDVRTAFNLHKIVKESKTVGDSQKREVAELFRLCFRDFELFVKPQKTQIFDQF